MDGRRLWLALALLTLVAYRAVLVHFAYFGPRPALPSDEAGWLASVALLAWIPFVCLATAGFLTLVRPRDPHALRAALMFSMFSLVFTPGSDVLPEEWRELERLIGGIASVAGLPFAVMLFFYNFPQRLAIERRLPWLKWSFASVSVALLLLPRDAQNAVSPLLFGWISLQYATVFTPFGMSLNAERPVDERRRLNLILMGALAGLMPLFVLAGLPRIGVRIPAPLVAALALLVSLFPLSFVYVVVRHQVFGVRLLVRRGLQWAFVSRGILLLEGLLLYYTFSLAFGSELPPELLGAMAALLVFALRGLNVRVMPALDKRFFREAYDERRVLTELSGVVRTLASDPFALVDRVTQTLVDTLHPRSIAVFLAEGLWPGPPAVEGIPPLVVGPGRVPCVPVRVTGDTPHLQRAPGPSAVLAPLAAGLDPAKPHPVQTADGRLFVPIVSSERSMGVLLLGEKLSEEPWSREDRELLLTVCDQVAVALENASLFRRVAEQRKLEREVEIAREVQERLWPRTLPPCSTLRYWGSCQPARGVGGDYYDFLPLGDGRLAIALGDISGKGISAALLMSSLHATLKSHAPRKGHDPAALLVEVNRLLYEATDSGRYATLFYGVYDEAARTLLYANAGHVPPILLRAGSGAVERLEKGGMVVGLFPDVAFENGRVSLAPGDLLLIFSDGVSEAEAASEEMFGEDRVAALARQHAAREPRDLHDLLLAEVAGFTAGMPPHDDTTLIVAKAV